jgi:hypothetical protein
LPYFSWPEAKDSLELGAVNTWNVTAWHLEVMVGNGVPSDFELCMTRVSGAKDSLKLGAVNTWNVNAWHIEGMVGNGVPSETCSHVWPQVRCLHRVNGFHEREISAGS